MATGDVRFFGFTNRTDDILARFLVPQTGLCGDLTSSCPEDSSMLYIHYDKATAAAVSAICLLSTQSEGGNIQSATLLIDGSNTAYGNFTLTASNDFNVTDATDLNLVSGIIPVGSNQILALLDPPNATLWVSLGAPQKLNPTWSSNDQTFTPDLSSCLSLLQAQTPQPATPPYQVPPYQTNKLYTLKVKPYGMNQFTGQDQTAITEAVIRTSLGKFPLKLFSAAPRSFGKYPATGNQTAFSEIRNCHYLNDKISCHESGFLKAVDVNRLRIDFSFYLTLSNSTNNTLGTARPDRYEIRSDSMAASESCKLSDCAYLALTDGTNIPFRLDLGFGVSEDFTSLSDGGFSWIKNLSVSRIRFRLKSDKKENYFDISLR